MGVEVGDRRWAIAVVACLVIICSQSWLTCPKLYYDHVGSFAMHIDSPFLFSRVVVPVRGAKHRIEVSTLDQ